MVYITAETTITVPFADTTSGKCCPEDLTCRSSKRSALWGPAGATTTFVLTVKVPTATDLQPSSPAVDYGTDLTAEGITFDILNRSRPFHGLFSAGAYESHDPLVGIRSQKALDVEMFKVFPNPAKNKITLLIKTSVEQKVQIIVTDMQGRTVLRKEIHSNPFENYTSRLSVRHLKNGEYLVILYSSQGISSLPLLIIK